MVSFGMIMLKKRIDVWPVLLALVVFSLQFAALFLSFFWACVVALGFMYFCGSIAAFQHHHGHVAVFRNKKLSEALDLMMSFQTGIVPYAWVLHHNIGHHGNYLNQYPQEDNHTIDASHWTRSDGSVMKRWEYVFYNRKHIHQHCSEIGKKATSIFKKYTFFRYLNLGMTLVFLAINPYNALLLFVLIPQLMVLLVFETTYDHHSGLHTKDKYEASRNILSRFYNISRLNLGYHTAHHIKPGLHWSELPQYHQTIETNIPENLISNDEGFWVALHDTIFSKKKKEAR